MSIILGSSKEELALADKRFLIKVVCAMSRFLLYGELSEGVVRQNVAQAAGFMFCKLEECQCSAR
jgi:hypothetical protein